MMKLNLPETAVYGPEYLENLAKHSKKISDYKIVGGTLCPVTQEDKKTSQAAPQLDGRNGPVGIPLPEEHVYGGSARASMETAWNRKHRKKRAKYRLIMTETAWNDILTEVLDHTGVETGGVMVGCRIGNDFFIREAIDSGPNALYKYAEFARDFAYSNHAAAVRARKYRLKEGAVFGVYQYHRHPGSMDYFSAGDFVSNIKFSRMWNGAVSSLVVIDPHVRMKHYYIDPQSGAASEIKEVLIDDALVEEAMPLRTASELMEEIEENEKKRNFWNQEPGDWPKLKVSGKPGKLQEVCPPAKGGAAEEDAARSDITSKKEQNAYE